MPHLCFFNVRDWLVWLYSLNFSFQKITYTDFSDLILRGRFATLNHGCCGNKGQRGCRIYQGWCSAGALKDGVQSRATSAIELNLRLFLPIFFFRREAFSTVSQTGGMYFHSCVCILLINILVCALLLCVAFHFNRACNVTFPFSLPPAFSITDWRRCFILHPGIYDWRFHGMPFIYPTVWHCPHPTCQEQKGWKGWWCET